MIVVSLWVNTMKLAENCEKAETDQEQVAVFPSDVVPSVGDTFALKDGSEVQIVSRRFTEISATLLVQRIVPQRREQAQEAWYNALIGVYNAAMNRRFGADGHDERPPALQAALTNALQAMTEVQAAREERQ